MSSPSILNFASNIDKDFNLYMQNIVGNDSINSAWYSFLLFLTQLGDPKTILLISVVIVLGLWLLKRQLAVVHFALTMLVAAGAVIILKKIISRERPITLLTEDGYSFPSGHAVLAAVFFPLIVYTFKHYIENKWLRRLFVLVMFALLLLIGWSRLYFGVHYLSDVFGGFLIGGLISAISILLMEAQTRKMTARQ